MRSKKSNGKISLNVISGTHVVLLGMDVEQKELKDFLGFAIKRTDHTEGEEYWLKGFKTFEAVSEASPCDEVETIQHPIQAFLWGDYSAKPAHKYTYELYPVYGSPKNLRKGDAVAVTISTENEDIGTHAVYFNRGVAGSQAFTRKFGNEKELSPEAYRWLSRGLDEALLKFIAKANGPEYSIRASVYEFSYMPVLDAFKKASDSGADVKIVYDHRKPEPYETSDECIEKAGIEDLMIRRSENKSYISHNKFIILLKNGKPVEVWTGSTNFTDGGIFGQSNVGHIVRDLKIAQSYFEYWQMISSDPQINPFRKWNSNHTPMPRIVNKSDDFLDVVFSPRLSEAKSKEENPYAMQWYAEQLEEARMMVNFTAAFGVNARLTDVFSESKEYLRYLILDNKGNGTTKERTSRIEANPSNKVAIGSFLRKSQLPGMLPEQLTDLNNHVKFVHTKYMILDALSPEPMLITGSANFSDASTKNNDENMLIIKGNTRVTDMYLGEFMRLFQHYYFRKVYNRMRKREGSAERKKAYLCPDNSWTKKYYEEGSIHWKERLRFRGDGDSGYSITFFDIDETLFHTTAKVLVVKDGKTVRELSNQEFNSYQLKKDEHFDFTQFRDAELFKDDSKPIQQTVDKIKEMSKTAIMNGSKIALLTARQSFEDMATFKQAFLDQGIPIEKIDINFAGDIAEEAGSVALAKKTIVERYLAHGEYQEAVLLDDNKENLEEFLSIAEKNNQVKFEAILVRTDGSFTDYQGKEAIQLAH
jgi:phosphatidylserine/phosphatidylglycerophosphate/cardiolipin synthase-like enzyme